MSCACDLHLHTCLSPCADDEMTPRNMVNMAALLGLDVIAVTDHNSAANCRAAAQAGLEAGVVVIPGLELCTAEEIHLICLFPEPSAAEGFSARVRAALPRHLNRPHIFGRQRIVDTEDRITGEEELMLLGATALSIEESVSLCRSMDGFCYPAHVDRDSYSILSSLGDIPAALGFTVAELSLNASQDCRRHPALHNLHCLRASDAHSLEAMAAAPVPPYAAGCSQCTPRALLAHLAAL